MAIWTYVGGYVASLVANVAAHGYFGVRDTRSCLPVWACWDTAAPFGLIVAWPIAAPLMAVFYGGRAIARRRNQQDELAKERQRWLDTPVEQITGRRQPTGDGGR